MMFTSKGGFRTILKRFGPTTYVADREFLEPAREIIESPPSPIKIVLAVMICVIVLFGFLVSIFGKVDIYAVASGRIQPSGRTKFIQPLESGKVMAVFVEDGRTVVAGQRLIDLDTTETSADSLAAAAQQGALEGEIIRRKALIAAAQSRSFEPRRVLFPATVGRDIRMREQAVFNADLAKLGSSVALLKAKIDEDQAHIRTLTSTLQADRKIASTLSRRVAMRADLQKDGWDSAANVMDAIEENQRELSSITSEQGEIAQAQAEINSQRKQIDDTVAQFQSDNSTALDTAEAKVDNNTQVLIKANAKLANMRLRSPISGTVQQLDVTTIGQVVTSGQQLMTIVPSLPTLEIEALLQNQDAGFVHAGQRAVIKIDSFPFTRYGTIEGTVVRIARDAVTSPQKLPPSDTEDKPVSGQSGVGAPTPPTQDLVFPVYVTLDKKAMVVDGKQVPLTAGMSATVEIRTGRRRVISYLLSPFVKTISETGHER